MENVDVVRSLPFSTDEFFAAIHECSNRRPEDTEFNRLTFCLLGVGTERFDPRHTRDAQSSLQGVIAIAFPPDGKTIATNGREESETMGHGHPSGARRSFEEIAGGRGETRRRRKSMTSDRRTIDPVSK